MAANRDVIQDAAGGWTVQPRSRSKTITSRHSREFEAIARAKEILKQAGGGTWRVKDATGRVLRQGKV